MNRLILASASCRRKEIMDMVGYDYEIIVSCDEEIFDKEKSIVENIENIAYNKALSVFKKNKDAVVIGADTIVRLDGKIYTKPKDKPDAKRMLEKFSGKSHFVTSAVAFISNEKSIVSHFDTKVTFKKISNEEIERYLSTDEPWDKAGGYAIQGKASVFAEKIEGCFYNVMGLPISNVYDILKNEFNILPKD